MQQQPDLGAEQLSCPTSTRIFEQLHGLGDWAQQPCRLGIDEAGRGPVLGPMVYAAAYAPIAEDLTKKSYADSKTLTAEARDSLFAQIHGDPLMGYCSEIMSASFISSNMLGKSRTSLNVLAMDSTFKIIRRCLDQGVNITEVFVDTVGDAGRYSDRLSREFPSLTFTVCPKADALYPIVSAASIVAKVVRDAALTVAAKECGVEAGVSLGSGYPGDPDTKAWLKAQLHPVWGYRQAGLVRFSWETVARLIADGGCVGLSWEADEEGGEQGGAKQQRITFSAKRQADVIESNAAGRQAFFRVRRLQRVTGGF